MATIVFVNTDNLHTERDEKVELHKPNCQHFARNGWTSNPWFDPSAPEEWATAQAFFDDYNADFYDEAGVNGCWDVVCFPFTGLVTRTTVITKPSYA